MIAPTATAHVSGTIASGNTLTLPSWAPDSCDLVLVGVHMDDDGITPTLAGNGLTFVLVASLTGGSKNMWLFRAQSGAPSSGSIVVTVTGNTGAVIAAAVRIADADTVGPNSAAAIEASTTATGSSADMQAAITTISPGALIVAWGAHSDASVFTPPADETSIEARLIETPIAADMWSLATTAEGSYTIGAAGDLDGSDAWHVIVVSIKPQPLINFKLPIIRTYAG